MKKFGFTLAEVLITLGIIGVVAALTMPTLIQSHKKHVVETRLKHFYSVINQAVKLSEAYNGDKTTWSVSENGQFWNYIEPYLKYTKIEDVSHEYNDNIDQKVYLSNGSVFDISFTEIVFYPEAKNLNKTEKIMGRDCFRFRLLSAKGMEPYIAHWNGDIDNLYTNSTYGCNTKSKSKTKHNIGAWCTAIIQRNGWKIPKNYPFKF